MKVEASKGNVAAEQHDGFFSIALSSLRSDTVAQFELYLATAGRKPILYRGANLRFTQEDIERLTSYGVDYLYVPTEQRDSYKEYVEEHLGEILSDPELPLNFRSNVAYKSAQSLVRDILEEPRAKGLLERSGQLVENTMDFMLSETDSVYHLISVMSFDYYTYTHSVNVMVFSSALAQRLGFSQDDINLHAQGALLHDVGKSQLDPSIVNCRGKLSEEQWMEMKKHPVYGYELLTEQGMTHPGVLDVMRHHHEKLSGSGYPDGLGDQEISPWVRICTIADIFDALTTKRSYKMAMESFPSLRLMHQEMIHELDQDFFRVFVMMMGKQS